MPPSRIVFDPPIDLRTACQSGRRGFRCARLLIRQLRLLTNELHAARVLVLICLSLSSMGCAAIQQRMVRRSEKCGSLCEQAREARVQGWPEQAELLLDEAIRHRPQDAETRRQLAEAMWEAGRRKEALEQLAEVAQLHPHDAKLQTLLAKMLWSNQDPAAAARTAEVALRLDPQSIDALFVKARFDAARGEYEHALASYVRLLQLAPDRLSTAGRDFARPKLPSG